ncbi:MAG: hypothetical protein JWL71_5156 [Acidobacteria bacterium]|nr:hypothetical protein [Acidobacteriota bacterium]
MNLENERQEYAAKAKEAEDRAARSKESMQSAAWVMIAEGYWVLAGGRPSKPRGAGEANSL